MKEDLVDNNNEFVFLPRAVSTYIFLKSSSQTLPIKKYKLWNCLAMKFSCSGAANNPRLFKRGITL